MIDGSLGFTDEIWFPFFRKQIQNRKKKKKKKKSLAFGIFDSKRFQS